MDPAVSVVRLVTPSMSLAGETPRSSAMSERETCAYMCIYV